MSCDVRHSREDDVRPKVIFVDRDDTITIDVCHCSRPEDLILFHGVPEAIAELNKGGYEIIVITNQSVIGRGMIDEEQLQRINEKMLRDIEKGGGRILDIFYCPHRPDENCECRKPKTKMGIDAIKKYNLDAKDIIMIGDSDADMKFAKNLGCEGIRVSKHYQFTDAVKDILKRRWVKGL